MKNLRLAPIALASLIIAACDKSSPETAKRIAELERQANEAAAKARELEAQLTEQQIATERDAIERERMRLEEDRLEMQCQQGEAAAAEAERIRQRETDLATREGRLMRIESELDDQQDTLNQRGEELSERERELAGREALAKDDDQPAPAAEPVGDFGMFHDSLSPYGSWFETPDYGYVWQPVVVRDSGWRPYTRGRWVCTDRGWTWVSDEPFGWACYHYGRWALCRGFGWVWVPGTEWAPAWVTWRSGGSHIGWAPLPPETLAWRGHSWDSSVEVTFGIGSTWFNFVETQYFCEPIHHHCLPYTYNDNYIGHTQNITYIHTHNRRVICGGPRYSDVAVQTKRRPPFYRIEEDRHARRTADLTAMRPRVEGNHLHVAAPNLDADWNDALRPSRTKGRIDQFQIERQTAIRPEVAERFRQSREDSRRKAEETVNRLGGREALQQARVEQQRTGRTEEKRVVAGANDQPNTVAPREEARRPGTPPATADLTLPPGMRPAVREEIKPPVRQPEIARREETPAPARPGTATPARPVAPREDMRKPGSNPEVVERLRESGMRPGTPPPPASRQDDRAEEQRQQQERQRAQQEQQRQLQERQRQQQQAELARQQQEQIQRQREQQERARQQQEQAERQREQQQRARQQQERIERQREQQERARQQQEQMERQREQQERSRQQQEQAERQRDQERQREQQRDQERQREQQRDQERQREQQRDEENRRGRNR